MAEEETAGETNEELTVHEALRNAVHGVMSDNGELVVKWFALVDVITAEGQRAMWTLYSEDLPPWDKRSMLDYAMAEVDYKLHSYFAAGEYYDEDDEDD